LDSESTPNLYKEQQDFTLINAQRNNRKTGYVRKENPIFLDPRPLWSQIKEKGKTYRQSIRS
jgi:hypothetical protein